MIGPELTPYPHGPGEFMDIPEEVIHVAANLSDVDELAAVEMRTDPMFDDDVVLTPQYDAGVAEALTPLRREFVTT